MRRSGGSLDHPLDAGSCPRRPGAVGPGLPPSPRQPAASCPPSSTRGEPAMRAALYARVSTERQERFQTIDSQLAALRDWAATGGHEISDDFVFRDEGYSGSRLDRPGLDALRDAVRDGVAGRSRRALPPWQAAEGARRPLPGRRCALRLSLRAAPGGGARPPRRGRERGRVGAHPLWLAHRRADDHPPDPQAPERRSRRPALRPPCLVAIPGAPHPGGPGLRRHGLCQPLQLCPAEEAASPVWTPHRRGDVPPAQAARAVDRHPRASEGVSQSFCIYPALSLRAAYAPPNRRWPMILSAIAEKLKRRSKDDFKGRHYEATLILQAVSWYLRYPLSYRDIEELFLERGLEVDHSTLNRWVLAYAPLIEKRLRAFRKPHCGSIRVDETYIKVRGQRRYLYQAIDKHGTPVDFLLTAKRDLDAAKRFFRKMLQDEPLLSPDRIGTDGAGAYPPAIAAAKKDGLLARTPVHYVTKHLQQGIESGHFRVKRLMLRIGGFRSFHTARRTIREFEAMLWLRKGS